MPVDSTPQYYKLPLLLDNVSLDNVIHHSNTKELFLTCMVITSHPLYLIKTCSYTLQRPLLLLSLCFQTDGGPGKGPNRHDLFHGWTALPLQCGLWGWQGCCESICLFIFISASMFAISVRLYLVVCLYSLSLEKPNAHSF